MIRNNKGFTLVELTLALAFVSVLLISVATTTIQLGQTYNRGLTIKAVNQAGRGLISEFQRTVNSANTLIDVSSDSTLNYRQQKSPSNINFGGRLCLGTYSYVWNYGRSVMEDSTPSSATSTDPSQINKYSSSNAVIRLVKIEDSSFYYCTPDAVGNLPLVDNTKSIELLTVGDRSLALHSFAISSNSIDSFTNSRLYNIKFSLGTNDHSNIQTDFSKCIEPGVSGSNLAYCTIEQFAISLTTGNSNN